MQNTCFLILIYALTIGSCSESSTTSQKEMVRAHVKADTVKNISGVDTLSFDSLFIQKLKDYPSEVKIEGRYLLVDNDTVYFPNDLRAGEDYVFTSKVDSIRFLLQVKRVNLTTLDYRYEERSPRGILYLDSGKAFLKPYFFLASEMDEDEIYGIGYGASEYHALQHPASLSLRIGIGSDDKGKLRAQVNYVKKGSPTWESIYPTLRTKKNP